MVDLSKTRILVWGPPQNNKQFKDACFVVSVAALIEAIDDQLAQKPWAPFILVRAGSKPSSSSSVKWGEYTPKNDLTFLSKEEAWAPILVSTVRGAAFVQRGLAIGGADWANRYPDAAYADPPLFDQRFTQLKANEGILAADVQGAIEKESTKTVVVGAWSKEFACTYSDKSGPDWFRRYKTSTSEDYQMLPQDDVDELDLSVVRGLVKASNDAHIVLELKDGTELEVAFGGWSNTKSVIRHAKQGTGDMLAEAPLRISWNAFEIAFSRGKWYVALNGVLILHAPGSCSSISKVGVHTGWGSKGEWRLALDPKYSLDFDRSMSSSSCSSFNKSHASWTAPRSAFFAKSAAVADGNNKGVPRVLHYLKRLVSSSNDNLVSWERHHAGWKVVMWDEDALSVAGIDVYQSCAKIGKAIVDSVGGVYFNPNARCYASLESVCATTAKSFAVAEVDEKTGGLIFGSHLFGAQAQTSSSLDNSVERILPAGFFVVGEDSELRPETIARLDSTEKEPGVPIWPQALNFDGGFAVRLRDDVTKTPALESQLSERKWKDIAFGHENNGIQELENGELTKPEMAAWVRLTAQRRPVLVSVESDRWSYDEVKCIPARYIRCPNKALAQQLTKSGEYKKVAGVVPTLLEKSIAPLSLKQKSSK